jgi:5-hydroxyisourate hydrolase-like protein (transthyretin family)
MARKLVIAALIVAALPTAAASAATLHLQAPKSVDREEMFRVVSFGKAQPERAYYLSVVFQDDNQGACAESLEKEVTTNKHFELHYLRKVTTDQDGRFEVRSRKIFGGEKASTGRFCGYLTNQDGTKNKDRVVRRIEFT